MKYPKECPVCSMNLVHPTGPIDAPLLLLGAIPTWEDVLVGRPWATSTRKDRWGSEIQNGADVFRAELRRAGIEFRDCRATNLWLHSEVKEKEESYPAEFRFHFDMMREEFKGRKGILIMGRQVIEMLTGTNITDVEFLNIKSHYFPASVKVAIVSKNPSIALTDGAVVGNVRFAIQRFADLTYKLRREDA